MWRRRGGVGRSRRCVAGAALLASLLAGACAPPLVGVLGPGGTGSRPSSPSPPSSDVRCSQPAPGAEFRRADPEQVDLERGAVADAVAYGSARGAQSVRVYRHDCLVGTSGLDPTTEWTMLPSWSMTKGVVSLVVGRAVTLGALEVDDPIGRHLAGLDPAHAAITVRQLLNQTSGLRFAWVNDLNAAARLDSVASTLTRPFESEPGTTFVYAQTTVTVLVAVVEAATGEDFQSFAARELFEPVGIPHSEWAWQRDGAGRSQGFAYLDMTPRAYGRLGSLLLHEGSWLGRTLVDPDYVRAGRHGTTANPGYGFLWWTNEGERHITAGFPAFEVRDRRWIAAAPPDTFGLSGLFDQQLVVIPSLDIVVVRMGLPNELFGDPFGEVQAQRPKWDHRFFRTLLGGLTDVDVPDPGDWVPDPPEPPIDWFHIVGTGF